MRPRTMRAALAALAVLVVFAEPGAAVAQVLVAAERNLDFGQITPGVVTAVAPSDLIRSAQLRIDGRGSYQVSFQLPTQLTSPAGHTIPLVFRPDDGLLTTQRRAMSFDPATTVSFRIHRSERDAQLNLGGQAMPAAAQVAGFYSATIVIMVVQTGT